MSKANFEKIIQLQQAHRFVKMLWLCRAPVKGRSCDFTLCKLLIFCIVRTFAIRSIFQLIKIRQLLNIFYIQSSKQRHQPAASSKTQLKAITSSCSPPSDTAAFLQKWLSLNNPISKPELDPQLKPRVLIHTTVTHPGLIAHPYKLVCLFNAGEGNPNSTLKLSAETHWASVQQSHLTYGSVLYLWISRP